MSERFIAIILGIISSLIAHWLTGFWSNLSDRERWLVSIALGIGVVVASILILSKRPSPDTETRRKQITDNTVRGSLDVENVATEHFDEVLTRNKVKGDFIAKNIGGGANEQSGSKKN